MSRAGPLTVTQASLTGSPETSVGMGGPGSFLTWKISACSPGLCPCGAALGTEGLHSRLVPGSHLPSVEDILQDGSCSEHRSLTQSENEPPVDVYLPGNGHAVGVRDTGPTCLLVAQVQGTEGPGGVVDCEPDHGQPCKTG